jgi:hypothetical protein
MVRRKFLFNITLEAIKPILPPPRHVFLTRWKSSLCYLLRVHYAVAYIASQPEQW